MCLLIAVECILNFFKPVKCNEPVKYNSVEDNYDDEDDCNCNLCYSVRCVFSFFTKSLKIK